MIEKLDLKAVKDPRNRVRDVGAQTRRPPERKTEIARPPITLDVLPKGVIAPQTPKDNKDVPGETIIAEKLAGNLGTAPEFLAQQKIDERKFAVLNDYTATAYGYFAYRGYKDQVEFWRWLVDWELTSSQGINGLARRHVLNALAAARGGMQADIVGKPNVFSRNLWNREWKEKAYKEGKMTTEDTGPG